jgi:hypothetical protein
MTISYFFSTYSFLLKENFWVGKKERTYGNMATMWRMMSKISGLSSLML